METHALKAMYDEYVMPTYNFGTIMTKANGSKVWDNDGREYFDLTMGISVCNLGHCHPGVTKAIQEQAAKLCHISNVFCNENLPRLAKKISDASFGGKVFFGNSGAEANEGMVKFARRWGSLHGGRHHIVCCCHSFHGRTLAMLAATDKAKYREGFQPDVQGFSFAEFNNLEAVKAAITPDTTAVMLEPVQGEGGIYPATADFMCGVRELCDKNNMLMLLDEVQCGMGRTGTMFAYQFYGIVPDAMSMAKALGNGVPIGAFEVKREYADVFQPGLHGTTFGGNPLATAAGLAVFEAFETENILENVKTVGNYFMKKLLELKEKYSFIQAVRGRGLMLGMAMGEKLKAAVEAANNEGVLVLTAGQDVMRLLPCLKISVSDIDAVCEKLDKAFSLVK